MIIDDLTNSLDYEAVGQEIYSLIERLFPLCRSITGEGLRATLRILQEHTPLEMHEVPSGTRVFDWTVPKEWNIKDAYVKNASGQRVVDFQKSNLHVLNYSRPVHKTISLAELKNHLFTIPEHPDWIPYKTSYYSENWGFCLSHNDFLKLEDDQYEVFIDSTLANGHLTYGEYFIKGRSEDEILISTHACHPSLANDNLSGVCLAAMLAKRLMLTETRYSYRFLFIPGTIGAIAWLCRNEKSVHRIRHGLVISGVGDGGNITYKRSRIGNADIDRTAEHVLRHSGDDFQLLAFDPYGYDERQYCSPGFNLPVGRISRTPYAQYPEYHTSADNLDFVTPRNLADTFNKIVDFLFVLENNQTYVNQNPKCEPQLGKHGLFSSFGFDEFALLWVLNLSDGIHTQLDIANRSGLEFQKIFSASKKLLENKLLKKC